MVMRLLPKLELDKAKATERRVAIDEGLKIARRVDNLREVAAEAETTLEKFRRETVARVNEEIAQKVKERNELETGNVQRRLERAELEKPLTAAWAEIDKENARLDTLREETSRGRTKLEDDQRETEIAAKKASKALARATTKEELATSLLADADTASKQATSTLANANRTKDAAVALKEKTNKELMHRDLMATSRERGVTMREQALTVREKELNDGWVLLKDRIATFERTLKRQ